MDNHKLFLIFCPVLLIGGACFVSFILLLKKKHTRYPDGKIRSEKAEMYTLGIDIGSTTSKAVILKDGEEIIATSLIVATVGTTGVGAATREVFENSGLTEGDIKMSIVTGYGRQTFSGADRQVSELTCHALGAHFLFPDVRTVIDIGGQDAKVLTLSEAGVLSNFVMNDKCAAGTGRFLDVMANILNLDISQLEEEASKSDSPLSISSTCTVFAESEVISQLANGANVPDLVAGICASVATRTASLAKRAGIKEKVCMTGGVARNGGVRRAMEKELGTQILFDNRAQLTGALGAAIYGYKQVI